MSVAVVVRARRSRVPIRTGWSPERRVRQPTLLGPSWSSLLTRRTSTSASAEVTSRRSTADAVSSTTGSVHRHRPMMPRNQRPDIQNILRRSYDYLTMMPKLRSTYDGCIIYQTSYEECKANSYVRFTCKVVRSSDIVFVN